MRKFFSRTSPGVATQLQVSLLTPLGDTLLGNLGLALLAAALLRLHAVMHRLLPRI